jgi:hypothetical protein
MIRLKPGLHTSRLSISFSRIRVHGYDQGVALMRKRVTADTLAYVCIYLPPLQPSHPSHLGKMGSELRLEPSQTRHKSVTLAVTNLLSIIFRRQGKGDIGIAIFIRLPELIAGRSDDDELAAVD